MAKSWKRNNKTKNYSYYLLVFIILLSLILLFLLKRKDFKPVVIVKPPVEKEYKKLYIVIDDVGNNIQQLESFLKLPVKMTFAVLPDLMFTREAENLIKASGHTYILHQPMEAIGGQNPGPGAILLKNTDEEIISILDKNISQFDNLIGINNHMGSLITSNERIMKIVLMEIKKRNINYLDSLTSSESVVSKVSEELGLNYFKRSVFLDNYSEKDKIMNAIEEGLQTADTKGYAVMIGHVWTNELAELLMEIYPELIERGYSFEDVSSLFKGGS